MWHLGARQNMYTWGWGRGWSPNLHGLFQMVSLATSELPRRVPTTWLAQARAAGRAQASPPRGERHKVPFLNANGACLDP